MVVFTPANGEPVHPHVLSQTFDRLSTTADVPRIRLHDLRRTHATLMFDVGTPDRLSSNMRGAP